jgi:hypothetical protein
MKAPALEDGQRDHLRRIHTRVSLLFDTCLAAPA